MKITTLLIVLICFLSTLYGQKALVLTKKRNGKEKIISNKAKLKVWTKSGNVYKGFYTIKRDSLCIADTHTISLDNIETIGKKGLGLNILGGGLSGIGGFATFGLGIATYNILSEGGLTLLALIVAVPMDIVAVSVTTTGVLMLLNGRRFNSIKWSYGIKEIDMVNK